jgi:hypothetical protein
MSLSLHKYKNIDMIIDPSLKNEHPEMLQVHAHCTMIMGKLDLAKIKIT